ncbi:hypothetical protein PRUPE_7G119200 [Prunus persica]|uniref:Uncharacterized protein n=1 Tax=Prunus persica TaxID=3760 RepID=A0A251NAC6_PRUPE|nr:hypothetical protein PRUPE_7G119200 [Prunus persica]
MWVGFRIWAPSKESRQNGHRRGNTSGNHGNSKKQKVGPSYFLEIFSNKHRRTDSFFMAALFLESNQNKVYQIKSLN